MAQRESAPSDQVTLPTDIASQMSNKTLVRSKQEYEMMEQRFDMQDISLKNEVAQRKLGAFPSLSKCQDTVDERETEIKGASETRSLSRISGNSQAEAQVRRDAGEDARRGAEKQRPTTGIRVRILRSVFESVP